jgi:hypothetical protein
MHLERFTAEDFEHEDAVDDAAQLASQFPKFHEHAAPHSGVVAIEEHEWKMMPLLVRRDGYEMRNCPLCGSTLMLMVRAEPPPPEDDRREEHLYQQWKEGRE